MLLTGLDRKRRLEVWALGELRRHRRHYDFVSEECG
jgi:hypothetical protein